MSRFLTLWPLYSVLITLAYQGLFYGVTVYFRFDKVTDLAGTSNFLILALIGYFATAEYGARQTVLTVMVGLWSVRLGAFLVVRVMERQTDARFDEMREKPLRLAVFWVLQTLWVWVVSLPLTLLAVSLDGVPDDSSIAAADWVGWALWVVGFVFESIADAQRFGFNRRIHSGERTGLCSPNAASPAAPQQSDSSSSSGGGAADHRVTTVEPPPPAAAAAAAGGHPKPFLSSGVWAISRHPNYFGEILLWVGVSISATHGQLQLHHTARAVLSWLSPLLTALLLVFLSGVPMAEKRSDEKHCRDERYWAYKRRTSPLLPFPPPLYAVLPRPVKVALFLDWHRHEA